MQNALCYMLLDDNKKDEDEPTRTVVWKLREATHRKAPHPKGKAPRKQQKTAPPKIKKQASAFSFSEEDLARENGGEPFDSPSSSERSDCDREEVRRRTKKLVSVKPQIDFSLVAAVSSPGMRRTLSGSDSEVTVSKPKRGSARRAERDSFTAVYLLQNMRFPGAKDNTMLKAKMVADLGETLGASTSLVELMIKYHAGISIRLEILNAYHSHVIGVDQEAEFSKEIELVKTIGLWPYLAEKATRGGTNVKMIAKLKKLARELPGCREIAYWGAETDWSEISTFAVRYDRETVRINRTRNEGGSARSEAPETLHQKFISQARPANTTERGTAYIEPEEWAKLTKEQKQAHVDKRKQNR
ncbi:uncharacterized protein LOC143714459 [Siphateles boraxobius]|uniref:uncharacterized protein LOC143714459 n=1 Tax=Siphateles boraxobius TaxID=180520 RepID=UPI0040639414